MDYLPALLMKKFYSSELHYHSIYQMLSARIFFGRCECIEKLRSAAHVHFLVSVI